MTTALEELLRVRFDEKGVASTRQAWAAFLGNLDKGTFSRILNGSLPLTKQRARKWAEFLFNDDSDQAAAFSRRLYEAAQESPSALSVSGFFEDMLARGGVIPAERITELFEALQSSDLERVLICCEYRDLPRAAPDARYEYLANCVGEAIAAGVSFAMFQPFGEEIPLPLDNEPNRAALNAAIYMTQVKTKCIDAYKLFQSRALDALRDRDAKALPRPSTLKILDAGNAKAPERDEGIEKVCRLMAELEKNLSPDELLISSRLKLYARSIQGMPYLGSGFQGRMFYIRYTTVADGINHARIMQWVSTPKQDLLVYRGQNEITPDALKDSFYPIPHFFDSPAARLPLKIDDSDDYGPGVRNYLKQRPGGEGLPVVDNAISIWRPYD